VVTTAANVEYHAKIVRDKAVLRRLIEAATAIIQGRYEGRSTSIEVLDNAEHRVSPVAQSAAEDSSGEGADLADHGAASSSCTQPGALNGRADRLHDLDRLTRRFQRGDLVIVRGAASEGQGGSRLKRRDTPPSTQRGIAVFSLEMSKEQLAAAALLRGLGGCAAPASRPAARR